MITRSEKRRQWCESWKEFYFDYDKMNFSRKTRRLAWKFKWDKYKNMNENNQTESEQNA
jgi:hypothetical protein